MARSTIYKIHIIPDNNTKATNNNYFPKSKAINIRINIVYYAIIQLNVISTTYVDLIGRFPK